MNSLVPQGFERHFRQSGMTDPWEPLYSRKLEGSLQLGLVVTDAHCNSRGLVHGGLIAALADNAMGFSCALSLQEKGIDPSSGLVTISLNTDYIGVGKLGEWLVVAPEVRKTGQSVCFVGAKIHSGGQLIATSSATFKIL